MEIINRSISSFLNTEVKEFARYVIETRACPKISDGLRSGARKIIYAALTGDLSKKNTVKMLALIGDTLKVEYHHGDTSLANTIIQLGRNDVIKHKPLEIIGQIPDLRFRSCKVASRYLDIKKSPCIELFTPDKELWTIKTEGETKIEPRCFFPIIPITLLYRTNSPGFGFSFRSFSYSIDSIIDLCIRAIATGTCEDKSLLNLYEIELKPSVEGVKDHNFVYNFQKESWFSIGEYDLNFETDTLTITDLPYSVDLDSYQDTLTSLKNRLLIKDWINLSLDDNIKYVIKFEYGKLKMLYNTNKWNFFQMFRLFNKVPKDTLNVLDDDNNILQIETTFQLIDTFVKNRLKIYDLRKILTIKNLKEEIDRLSNIIKFINLVISGELIISKRTINDVKFDLDRYNLPYEVLRTRIEKLTKEEIEKIKDKIRELNDYLNYIETTTIETMYINELITLKEKFGKHIISKI